MYHNYNVELCHFGDDCAPGIIIDDILNIHKKQLFMLGYYNLNDILSYLMDNNYMAIYDKNYLKNHNQHVEHEKYRFIFNHDYKLENNEIINYDFIKNRFENKINNFEKNLRLEKFTIFINFSQNVDDIRILDVLNWLKNNKKNFHLMIFTSNHYSNYFSEPNLSIIKLSRDYQQWWNMEPEIKENVYKEIYEKFIEVCKNKNIHNNFPQTFRETNYKL
jgi:hypothetical protein